VRLDAKGIVTVETDMTDIGTGSYTIIAQTAAEMMGVPLDKVVVKLGDSAFPVSAGSGGQWGANSATAGVYAACVKLREAMTGKLGLNAADAQFRRRPGPLGRAQHGAGRRGQGGELVAEDKRSSSAISTRSISSRPSAPISSRSASMPRRPRCESGACWRSAPPAASSTRSRRAAR
jgi:CO/xanthine dehydrogenase Mo-binding subunit